jgi:hypothetical protein
MELLCIQAGARARHPKRPTAVAHWQNDDAEVWMALTTFSLVLIGDSFPVQSIKIEDFKFRHRDLKETMRVPVALQAENSFVALQILPERFEVTVKNADHLPQQIEGVTEMTNVFLDYVGKRTLSALGHNVQWHMVGSDAYKEQLIGQLTRQDAIADILGTQPRGTDVLVKFAHASATECQANFATKGDGDAFVHFNFHYDLQAPGSDVALALSEMSQCVETAERIGKAADATARGRIAS